MLYSRQIYKSSAIEPLRWKFLALADYTVCHRDIKYCIINVEIESSVWVDRAHQSSTKVS